MKVSSKTTIRNSAKNVALIAIMAASISGGKMALAFLPNIEIVTLLCALYGYVFGPLGLAAIFIFVICETFIWGFGTWIISYFIYWPLVCCVFWLFRKFKIKNRIILTFAAVVLTMFFGVLTSLIDVGLFMGLFDMFWYRFSIYYMRGILYYVIQIVCNIAGFSLVFRPLSKVLMRHKERMRNIHSGKKLENFDKSDTL